MMKNGLNCHFWPLLLKQFHSFWRSVVMFAKMQSLSHTNVGTKNCDALYISEKNNEGSKMFQI